MSKLEQAHANMLKQQVRTGGVVAENVLELIAKVPREWFVPSPYQQLAYAEAVIPLGHGQAMLPPMEVAQILQALVVKETDTVLQIGIESGYLAAMLAHLAKKVYALDVDESFLQRARTQLTKMALTNVELLQEDALKGWAQHAPYDVIVVTGSLPNLSIKLRNQLALGGRIFAIIGNSPVMEATIIKRLTTDEWQRTKLFETDWPRLPFAQGLPKFVF